MTEKQEGGPSQAPWVEQKVLNRINNNNSGIESIILKTFGLEKGREQPDSTCTALIMTFFYNDTFSNQRNSKMEWIKRHKNKLLFTAVIATGK